MEVFGEERGGRLDGREVRFGGGGPCASGTGQPGGGAEALGLGWIQVSAPTLGLVVLPGAHVARAVREGAVTVASSFAVSEFALVTFAAFLGEGALPVAFAPLVLAEVLISVLEDV